MSLEYPASISGRTGDRSSFIRLQRVRWGVVLLLVVALVAALYQPILRKLAAVLIVDDSLEPAAAIVVLCGHLPFRAMEAANLYREGWASRVVLIRQGPAEERQALQALGVTAPDEADLSREVLIRLGVPPSAILIPQEGVRGGTLEELQIAAQAIRPNGAPVILVTSKTHTRRVRLTWRYVTGGRSHAIARAARQDPFDSSRWWRDRRFAMAVVREYLGLLNYGLGFPVTARAANEPLARK